MAEVLFCNLYKNSLQPVYLDGKLLISVVRDTARNTQLLEEQLTTALQQVKHLEKRCEDRASQQAKAELYKVSQNLSESAKRIVWEDF